MKLQGQNYNCWVYSHLKYFRISSHKPSHKTEINFQLNESEFKLESFLRFFIENT